MDSVRFACGQRVVVVSRDTDVLVLFHFKHLLPRDSTLLAFHVVTGCDTVSQFAGHGNVTACKAFKQNSPLLTSLGCGKQQDKTLSSAEKFVCKVYESLTDITNIDQMRAYLFNKGKDADSLPLTSNALKLHISQAHYQTTLWLNATVPSPERMALEAWPLQQSIETKAFAVRTVLEFVRSCCNALAKPVPEEDANANITCIPSFGCGSVTCGNPLTFLKTLIQEMNLNKR